jgi:hypothetical protein
MNQPAPAVKVTSRDFVREMRAALGPVMQAAGYAPVKGGTALWQKEAQAGAAGRVWSCHFALDKWGWEPVWGSSFNLEFSLGEVAGARSLGGGRSQRLGMLLEGRAELEELRLANNAVIARLPGTREGRLVTQRLGGGQEIVVQGVRAEPPIEVGFDYWLNYHGVEDVRQWGAWLAPRMGRFLDWFEADARSPFGEGRRRFDAMLGRVQALPAGEREAKVELLESYRREETEHYWQRAADFWIDEIRQRGGKGATL